MTCARARGGRNGGVVRGAMSPQLCTLFRAVEPCRRAGRGHTWKRGGRAFRDSFASLAGYPVERAGDAPAERRPWRSCDEGDEDEDDDDERRSKAKAAKAAVIDVARGNGTGIDDAENCRHPALLPLLPSSTAPPPATVRPGRRRLASRRATCPPSGGRNAECSLKPPVLLKPRRGASGARRMGPLEAAARRAGEPRPAGGRRLLPSGGYGSRAACSEGRARTTGPGRRLVKRSRLRRTNARGTDRGRTFFQGMRAWCPGGRGRAVTTRTEQADDDGENREIQTMNSRTIDLGARPGVVRPATADIFVGLRATFRDSGRR